MSNATSSCAAVRNAFANVTIVPPSGDPLSGHQNLTYCCARALLTYFDNDCIDSSIVHVSSLTIDSQWPCGAKWDGQLAGSPTVQARWEWLAGFCPGWQLSAAGEATQWLQLLVGFILPALIFSLNIPRRSKFRVWDQLFPEDISGYRLLVAVAGAIVAMIIVLVDNIFWLLTVLAAAAPCLISGVYEGWLDKKVLMFLDTERTADSLPLALRARMLFSVLAGNLDLYPAWSDTMILASSLDELDEIHDAEALARHVEQTAKFQRQVDGGETAVPSASPIVNRDDIDEKQSTTVAASSEEASNGPERTLSRFTEKSSDTSTRFTMSDNRRRRIAGKVSSRLNAMLACQYGFGVTIGGPVLYYIGAFIYAIVEITQTYGNRDLSHALGLGMWFMVLPHCAIISGFLLGGNNPNTLEGIVGAKENSYSVRHGMLAPTIPRQKSTFGEYQEPEIMHNAYTYVFERVYRAAYVPASMWHRGQSKQKWLLVHCTSSLLRYKDKPNFMHDVELPMQKFIRAIAMFEAFTWIYLITAAFSLVFIPCLLGWLISYWTPQIGLSCRSFSYTMYMASQTLLLLLWTMHMTLRDKYWRQARLINRYMGLPGQKDKLWEAIQLLANFAENDTTQETKTELMPLFLGRRNRSDLEGGSKGTDPFAWPAAAEWTYHVLMVLAFVISIFSAVGGLLMELLGVFRSNFCNINVTRWLPGRRAGSWVTLSTNSAEAIRLAKAMWIVLGAVSLAFLMFSCYIGWWYQRRLRIHFRSVAGRLDQRAPSKKS